MMQDPTICAAISGIGTILALLAATLVSMGIAGIFKELSGKVRRIIKYHIIPIWLLGFNYTHKLVRKLAGKPLKSRKSLQRQP